MTWLDIVILVLVALATLQGRMQGAVRAFITLAGVLVAALVAGIFYDDLADSLSPIITNDHDAIVVGFLSIFFATYLGSELLAGLSTGVVSLLLLGPWTRPAGMGLGALKALLLVDAFLIFLVTYPSLGMRGVVDDSALAPFFVDDFPIMRFLLPGEFDAAAAAF
ncbi:MAG TPA: CvpA family protein [Dehalococcoidia bacterium]|nr:CvpA family protein [Dehalococcoidia bacterium]